MTLLERDREKFQEGIEKGIGQGIKEAILDLLSDIGEVDQEVRMKIEAQCNVAILKQWNKLAARANTIEDFLSKI